jgi:hypothetical protein
VEDLEFLTYYSGGDSDEYVADGVGPSAGGGAVSVKHGYCAVTFILREAMVEKLNYVGRTTGLVTKGEQFAFVLQNCML